MLQPVCQMLHKPLPRSRMFPQELLSLLGRGFLPALLREPGKFLSQLGMLVQKRLTLLRRGLPEVIHDLCGLHRHILHVVKDLFTSVPQILLSVAHILGSIAHVFQPVSHAALVSSVPTIFAAVPEIFSSVAHLLTVIAAVFSAIVNGLGLV